MTERSEVGFMTQGLPRRRVVVSACSDESGLWVELRRHNGKPWQMSPAIARGLAGLLREAADQTEAMR